MSFRTSGTPLHVLANVNKRIFITQVVVSSSILTTQLILRNSRGRMHTYLKDHTQSEDSTLRDASVAPTSQFETAARMV
jgi:hypothetical protein